MDLVCITVTEKLPFYFKRPPINVVSVTVSILYVNLYMCINTLEKGQKKLLFLEGKKQRLVINRQFKKRIFFSKLTKGRKESLK